MPLVRFDDLFPIRRETVQLSDVAFRLHFEAICWTVRNGTAGNVSTGELRLVTSLRRPMKHVTELVGWNLWIECPHGWNIPQDGDRFDWWSIERTDYRKKIPSEVRRLVYERDEFRCVICGTTDDLTLDHAHPWSLGGSDDESNLRTLCRSCNSSKGARI